MAEIMPKQDYYRSILINVSVYAVQLNETVVEVYFSRPLLPNSQIIACNIFRDNILLSNGNNIPNIPNFGNKSFK